MTVLLNPNEIKVFHYYYYYHLPYVPEFVEFGSLRKSPFEISLPRETFDSRDTMGGGDEELISEILEN